MKYCKGKGFSLIELAAVVAIIALMAAITIPKAAGYVEQSRAKQLRADAQTVMRAIERYNLEHRELLIPADGQDPLVSQLYEDYLLEYIKSLPDKSAIRGWKYSELAEFIKNNTLPRDSD